MAWAGWVGLGFKGCEVSEGHTEDSMKLLSLNIHKRIGSIRNGDAMVGRWEE